MVHCMGALHFGYNTAIASPALNSITHYFDLGTLEQELVVSIVLVGALLGAIVSGYVADIIGRNKILLASDVVFLAGIVVEASAPVFWALIIGRFVVGLGVGIVSVAVPLMATEIAPKEIRGEIGTTNQLCVTIGIFLAYALGTVFSLVHNDWRWMFAFAGVFSLIHIVGALLLRIETPQWYAIKGDTEGLRRTLQRLRNTEEVEDEVYEIQQSAKGKFTLRNAVNALTWRVLVISLGILFFQQITGINAIMYYMSSFFQLAGMSADDSNYVSMGVGAVNVVTTVISIFLLDRAGRKPLLLYGLSFMCVSLLCIGLAFFFEHDMVPSTLGGICIICTVTFVIGFAISLGPVPWIIISEICRNECRALVMSLGLGVSWLTNLALSLSFLSLINLVGKGPVFIGFCVLTVAAIVFVVALIKETKGKSVDEIQQMMSGREYIPV
eukprot:TRINITY_DN3326_c1_g1_i1.p1 TRINITY_DN3326_c1_g1~~TRINITY_DN3326_c1_g1_i1.p1  ORF type:complete len:496 (-),score=110.32 TRINITY_DN3326_c1_g1_i1:68-1390(-)